MHVKFDKCEQFSFIRTFHTGLKTSPWSWISNQITPCNTCLVLKYEYSDTSNVRYVLQCMTSQSKLICIYGMVLVRYLEGGGGFFLACKDLGRMFNNSFPTCVFFCLFFFYVEISSGKLTPFFRPGSVHSGSASWDDCDRVFLMSCVWARFLIDSHTLPGQWHSQPTPTSIDQGCMCVLHFWQNDRGLLYATAVTGGWNGHWIRVSWLWRRLSRCSCRDSNLQSFNHKFSILTYKLSWLRRHSKHIHIVCHTTLIIFTLMLKVLV